jgi:hypothetical protein
VTAVIQFTKPVLIISAQDLPQNTEAELREMFTVIVTIVPQAPQIIFDSNPIRELNK